MCIAFTRINDLDLDDSLFPGLDQVLRYLGSRYTEFIGNFLLGEILIVV